MPKKQLDLDLPKDCEEVTRAGQGTVQRREVNPLPPVPSQQSKARPGSVSANTAEAFARRMAEHAPTLDAKEVLALGSKGRTKSVFGELVQRLLTRRAADAKLPRESAFLALAAGQAEKVRKRSPAGGSPVSPPTANASTGGGLSLPPNLDPELVVLVNRVTGGFLESEYILADSLGATGYLTHHFNLTASADTVVNDFFTTDVPDISVNPNLPNAPSYPEAWDVILNGTASDIWFLEWESTNIPPVMGNGIVRFFQGATIGRAILSRRMLLERMTEFWTDHFNIDLLSPYQGLVKPVDDRVAIRNNALTSFPNMLSESAHSPAMLLYLDQATSTGPNPNENYARELLELHTVGEGQGYNEDDVKDVARILTGFTYSLAFGTSDFLTFEYNSSFHVDAPAGGYSILKLEPPASQIFIPKDTSTGPEAGRQEGEDLLVGLQMHRNTAEYIASKMLRFMLRYEPSAQQISRVADVYQSNSGSIEAMLREILKKANLARLLVPDPTTLKVKRPFQLATTFLRSVCGTPAWTTSQTGVIDQAGTGYSLGDRVDPLNGPLVSGGSHAVFEVDDVDLGTGAVKRLRLLSEGDYDPLPFATPSTTSTDGSGTGLTVSVYPAIVNPFELFIERLRGLSNAPFEWGPPDGYPDSEQAWIENLLGRWQLLGDLARNQVKGIVVDQDALVSKLAAVPGAQVGAYLNMVMTGSALTAEEESLVQGYFDFIVLLATTPIAPGSTTMFLPPSEYGVAVAELFASVGAAPSYQYY